ncbi:L,D-transpeptidase family protein [Paenibacillus oenotherae]|uniref:L,D-transpeptidase family protein n=2 Tax=Paenibacillus oenotherae TaxID=1435645 RepID=A0ABS7D1W1_9BACL|nr:L,D-transpeptidase family protein [Paenibacillus oenotherae]
MVALSILLLSGSVSADALPPHYFKKIDALNATQVVIVTAEHKQSFRGTLSLVEKIDGEWQTLLSDIPVVLGSKGIGKAREGDRKTPLGVYKLGKSFGTVQRPEGIKQFYVQSTKDDYWIDDPASPDYNRWVRYTGNPSKKWKSYEQLHIPLYKYAVIIRYNTDPIQKNKGSAIFMHIWKGPDKPTGGCVAMSEQNLLTLLRMLHPDKSPVIAIQ